VIKLDDYQIHDVANALKRFFRTLDAPLLTTELYQHWINAASSSSVNFMLSFSGNVAVSCRARLILGWVTMCTSNQPLGQCNFSFVLLASFRFYFRFTL